MWRKVTISAYLQILRLFKGNCGNSTLLKNITKISSHDGVNQ